MCQCPTTLCHYFNIDLRGGGAEKAFNRKKSHKTPFFSIFLIVIVWKRKNMVLRMLYWTALILFGGCIDWWDTLLVCLTLCPNSARDCWTMWRHIIWRHIGITFLHKKGVTSYYMVLFERVSACHTWPYYIISNTLHTRYIGLPYFTPGIVTRYTRYTRYTTLKEIINLL